MKQNVRVAVAKESLFIRDIHAADNALATFHEFMNIKSDTGAETLFHFNSFIFDIPYYNICLKLCQVKFKKYFKKIFKTIEHLIILEYLIILCGAKKIGLPLF